MKKLLFCFIIMLFYKNIIASMYISYQLPSHEVLIERFKEIRLQHFYTYNKLENSLANRFLTPLQSLIVINDAIDNYKPYFYIETRVAKEKFRSCIMQTIFKDSPRAWFDLKLEGFTENVRVGYKPILIIKPIKMKAERFS